MADNDASRTVWAKTHDESETLELGRQIGALLRPGDIVGLIGDLAAGKTWLARGIAYGLGVPEHEYVTSPAYDVIHEYKGQAPVYHMDFYRIDERSPDDYLWLEEYITAGGVCILEWADKFVHALTDTYLRIELEFNDDPDARLIRFTPSGERYRLLVEQLVEHGLARY